MTKPGVKTGKGALQGRKAYQTVQAFLRQLVVALECTVQPPQPLRQVALRVLFAVLAAREDAATAYRKRFEADPPLSPDALRGLVDALARLPELTPAGIGGLYEQLLLIEAGIGKGGASRKASGTFYTPAPIAEEMVEAALSFLNRQPECGILDPAAGGGIFLSSAYRSLVGRGVAPQQALEALYGVDLDPVALEAAALSLSWLSGRNFAAEKQFYCGNALLGAEAEDDAQPVRAVWERRFPQPLARGGFDLILGNPPYLSVKQGERVAGRERYQALYRTAEGQYDLYGCFVELALQLLRPGGVFAFVLPKPMLVNAHQSGVRRLILAHRVMAVWDLGLQAFSGHAAVESVAVFVKKEAADERHTFPAVVWPPLCREERTIRQHDLDRYPEKSLNLWLTPRAVRFLDSVERDVRPFETWLAAPCGRGMEMGKRQLTAQPAKGLVPVVTGEAVSPFYFQQAPSAFGAFSDAEPSRCKVMALYAAPKLVVRRVANRLIAAVDASHGHVTLNTLYNFHFKTPADCWLAAALLNAEVMQAWFRLRFYCAETLFPYLRLNQLLALPMPSPECLERGLEKTAEAVVHGQTYREALVTLSHKLHNESLSAADRRDSLETLNCLVNQLYGLAPDFHPF